MTFMDGLPIAAIHRHSIANRCIVGKAVGRAARLRIHDIDAPKALWT